MIEIREDARLRYEAHEVSKVFAAEEDSPSSFLGDFPGKRRYWC